MSGIPNTGFHRRQKSFQSLDVFDPPSRDRARTFTLQPPVPEDAKDYYDQPTDTRQLSGRDIDNKKLLDDTFKAGAASPIKKTSSGDVEMSWRLWAGIISVAVGSSFQFGFATGSLNSSYRSIQASFAANGHPITHIEWGTIVSMFG
jgi:hypothetical protein